MLARNVRASLVGEVGLMSAYREGVNLMADDVLSTATTWNDFTSAIEEYAQGWGVPASDVGDDVLSAIAARWGALTS
jgi:hypothetical protein